MAPQWWLHELWNYTVLPWSCWRGSVWAVATGTTGSKRGYGRVANPRVKGEEGFSLFQTIKIPITKSSTTPRLWQSVGRLNFDPWVSMATTSVPRQVTGVMDRCWWGGSEDPHHLQRHRLYAIDELRVALCRACSSPLLFLTVNEYSVDKIISRWTF